MPFRLRLPPAIYAAMIAQARAELPNECCGFLAGRLPAAPAESGPPGAVPLARVEDRYPLVNEAKSPRDYYCLEHPSLFQAYRDMRRRGQEVLAIYHSHPTAAAVPSARDLERNFYGSTVIHFIISMQGDPPVLRGWWLAPTDYQEAEWECGD